MFFSFCMVIIIIILIIIILWDTFAACVTIYLFNFSSTVFSFSFVMKVGSDDIFFLFYWFAWFLVSSSWYFAWLDLTLRLFFAIYIFAFLPVLIALMVLSTVLPPYSLMLSAWQIEHHNQEYSFPAPPILPPVPSCLPQYDWLQVSTVLWKLSKLHVWEWKPKHE